ncbi:hypothetical protein ZIOFF_066556 [Zingiber officinale]|uniref:ceramide glucosyltransferase n=1 Tax=Zingiber officinale TaxID=94328 RepID=A0A8J5KDY8_ZINOF|nr:hypothetical protein ZIOFF_066556 [Zingiber officinale]
MDRKEWGGYPWGPTRFFYPSPFLLSFFLPFCFRKRRRSGRSGRECLDLLFACGVDSADVRDRASCLRTCTDAGRQRNGGDGHTGRALGRGEQSLLQPLCHLHPDPGGHIWQIRPGCVICLTLALGWGFAAHARNRAICRMKRTITNGNGFAFLCEDINDLEHSAQVKLPRVSVIMPLKGFGEHNLQNWRSQITSLYGGPLEFLFIVESTDDPAYHAVSTLISEFQFVTVEDTEWLVSFVVLIVEPKIGVERMHRESKYVLFLDDDVRLHPGSIGALTAEMEKHPEIFIQTGYPLDLPSGSLGSYCIYEYHMGLLRHKDATTQGYSTQKEEQLVLAIEKETPLLARKEWRLRLELAGDTRGRSRRHTREKQRRKEWRRRLVLVGDVRGSGFIEAEEQILIAEAGVGVNGHHGGSGRREREKRDRYSFNHVACVPCSMGFATGGKTFFLWGGCMMMHAEDFRKDLYGIVSGLRDGGYSDDMTLAAIAGNVAHFSPDDEGDEEDARRLERLLPEVAVWLTRGEEDKKKK